MLASCSWAQGLPWSAADTPNDTLGENEFSFSQQIPIANSFLVRGGTLPTSPQCWDCACFEPVQALHMLSALSSYVHQSRRV